MDWYLDHAPCLYFSSLDDGTIVEVNTTLCRQLGYRKEELEGQKLEAIFTVPTRIFQQTHLFPLLKMQGYAEEIYVTLKTKGSEQLPVLINAERKIADNKGVSVFAGIVVLNRKRFEDELVAAKKAAEAALNENTELLNARRSLQKHAEELDRQILLTNKQNEELRQFNRVVTHDLQEPLRKLFVFTGMLDDKNNETKFNAVDRIKKVSEQMRAIISGLQQYVWLTETEVTKTRTDLEDLIEKALCQLQKEYAEVAIYITKENLPTVVVDAEQMQFLFCELLSNAIRFRKRDEVHLHIFAHSLQLNKFRAMPEKYDYAEYLKIQIKDDGTGFESTFNDQAFELFRRFHSVSGRGIGLSLCKKIIENHNGNIYIDSKTGEGTTVTLLLPLFETPDENEFAKLTEELK
jgi:phosphoserine phosphatase RsbU/P